MGAAGTLASWIDEAEREALRELQLLPWQFWRLTPGEWQLLRDGARRRTRRRWWQLAVVTTWLIAPWTTKVPKAESLLGWSTPYRDDD